MWAARADEAKAGRALELAGTVTVGLGVCVCERDGLLLVLDAGGGDPFEDEGEAVAGDAIEPEEETLENGE